MKKQQEIWDRQLLRGWTDNSYIIEVATAFLSEVKPELVSASGRIEAGKKFREFFVPLGLKRCLDVD